MGGMSAPVEIVAHRGSREAAYEHTYAAYRKAIADGADTLECDVRLTADGHLVCLHDRRLDFVSGSRGVVSTMSLADLGAVALGVRRPWRFFDRYRGRSRAAATGDLNSDETGVLPLRRLLELVASAGRPVGLAIETKHPTRYGGLAEARLVSLLAEFGLASRSLDVAGRPAVRVMSFSATSLRRMRRLGSDLDLVLLMGRLPRRRRDGSLPDGVRTAGIDVKIIRRDPGYVARAHAKGNRVHVWTVNDPADVEACLAAGVDALITDRPLAVRRQVFAQRPAE